MTPDRGLPAFVVIALAVVVLAGCGGSHGISLPCSPQPQGALCLKVFTDPKKGEVTDVIAYLSVSGERLKGKTWRLVVTTGGANYPGPTRHGNPSRETFCRPSSTLPGCDDRLEQQMASVGDFGPELPVPFAATSAMSVCLSEQLLSGGKWRTGPAKRICDGLSALR